MGQKPFNLENLEKRQDKFRDYEYPKVSIILPTYNSATSIALSVEGVLKQNYPDLELIIVDAGSTDRTLEIVRSFSEERLRIFTVSDYQRYVMLNKGLSQVTGSYVGFLFPGDYYLNKDALKIMMYLALENDSPELVYCGMLIRDGTLVKMLYRPFSLKLMKKGLQPTGLQSCWFRADVFDTIDNFDPIYELRGGFDLMCRFILQKGMREASSSRILIDYDLRQVTIKMVTIHFKETFKIIYRNFGLFSTICWFFSQKDVWRIFRHYLSRIRTAFSGR